ncbi:MAG: hypothetical protein IT320_14695 [Anaerolineae bacterium]|nr:hypothetical protein [Anaerolineae bacterium]
MSVQEEREMVGRVLRASTTGFDCGTRGSRIDERHTFGSFVKVPIADDFSAFAIGLIYAIRIEDDPLARELVMASIIDNSVLLDQRENRMVPIEIAVINVGYTSGADVVQALPPRPPLSLSEVQLCSTDEIYYFTRRFDYFRVVLSASEVPSDELLAAAVRTAAWAYPESERYNFLVHCGRQLANLLSHDLKRLSRVLALIKPDTNVQ